MVKGNPQSLKQYGVPHIHIVVIARKTPEFNLNFTEIRHEPKEKRKKNCSRKEKKCAEEIGHCHSCVKA